MAVGINMVESSPNDGRPPGAGDIKKGYEQLMSKNVEAELISWNQNKEAFANLIKGPGDEDKLHILHRMAYAAGVDFGVNTAFKSLGIGPGKQAD